MTRWEGLVRARRVVGASSLILSAAGCGGSTAAQSAEGLADAATETASNAIDASGSSADAPDRDRDEADAGLEAWPDASGGESDAPAPPDLDAALPDAVTGTSCDTRQLRCRIAEQPCPDGQVRAIVNGCYGDCVAIDECACSAPEDCPQPDIYTCHNFRQRCGPFL